MTKYLRLLPRHRNILLQLIEYYLPPNITVWAYGSRVNGRSHEGSDLDLVLRSPDLTPIEFEQLISFKKALQESNIPIVVEARDWAHLPESFHREIEQNYVVLTRNK